MESKRLQAEQDKRAESFELLDQLEGFNKLTDTQQRMIRASLYLQDRNERKLPLKGNYNVTKRYADKLYCHSAAYCVEKEIPLANLTEAFNPFKNEKDQKKQEEYEKGIEPLTLPTYEQIEALIKKTGFPALVAMGDSSIKFLSHSFIALGTDQAGEIIGWEKKGIGIKAPFRLITLRDAYKVGYYCKEWGVRSFGQK